MFKNKYVLFLLYFFIVKLNYAQLSKTHYIPPITDSGANSSEPLDQYIYISTPNTTPVNFTIKQIGLNNDIKDIVVNNSPYVHDIGNGRNTQLFSTTNQTSRITNNKGFIIEADFPVYVSVRINAGSQAGALVSKGASGLGKTFRVGAFTNLSPTLNYLNFVSVMATEDDTNIDFSDINSSTVIEAYNGPNSFSINLNQGESYIIATNSALQNLNNTDGIIGALIESNKDIVVNCGSSNGSFGEGNGRDYGMDQIAGLSKVGQNYIFVRGDGNDDWENALIVAHVNNTEIRVNGSNTPITTINAGDHFLLEGIYYNSEGNMFVETNQPVFAYQGVGGLGNNGNPNDANQGMFFVPPLSCEARGNINNIANIDEIGSLPYTGGITIVTRTGANVTVRNNNRTFPIGAARTVTGNPDYVTYRITDVIGNISVEGNDELYCAYFNYSGAATSGGFYSGFPSPPEINFDTQFETLGNCIPNITLEASQIANFDTYEWFINDGTGFVTTNITTPSIKPTLPGRYKLLGTIACSGLILESAEIPVSLCPSDIDNDGIIDNIDIDNDNDGILNCEESNGNVILDLSSSRNPILRFQDGANNMSIATNNSSEIRTNTGTNTFNLRSNGDITSTITEDTNAQNNYNITFTAPVNIKFTEALNTTKTVVTGEFFIAQIIPGNKNITLIDPDNQLLVDTNFDGIFETGVTQFSGSEIQFRINPSPNGNTPYQFSANQVTGFSLTHNVTNTNQTSTFNGNIALTCFNKDNDNDGIPDALDLDSDNDGIPDFIEHTGTIINLLNTDANLDGLDDAYNVNTLAIDTDNDGVIDVYDLDSDNDGIFDITESGQLNTLLTDANFDGIEDSTNLGANGWIDTAETVTDSGIIAFTPSDTDQDTIFNYLDSDSDNDNCNDVTEAGFTDNNNDNFLGDTTPTVNALGLVNNTTIGYTAPNNDYIIEAPIIINQQPQNTNVCNFANTIITVVLDTPFTTIQWQASTDDGVTWTNLTNNTNYNGVETENLNINNTPVTFNNYQYRVQITRNGNTCGLTSQPAILVVNNIPTVNTPVTLIQCDDDDNNTLGFSLFNLTESEIDISQNTTNETFSYYTTEAAARNGDTTSTAFISNPSMYQNVNISNDNVWARVENSFGCFSTAAINLVVSSTSVLSNFPIQNFYSCDDFLDENGLNNSNNNDRDGITTFNFSNADALIQQEFTNLAQTGLTATYYRNEQDALIEQNQITDISNYRNIDAPNSQTIFVRVDSSTANDCLGLRPLIQLNVEALPDANTVANFIACDDDTDGFVNFNTAMLESTLVGNQNINDLTIVYTNQNGDVISSPFPNSFTTQTQTINVAITNNTTNEACTYNTSINFIVNTLPIANPVTIAPACDGDSGDIDNDLMLPFNLSSIENTVLGNQVGMDIFYTYIDNNNNQVTQSPTLPNTLLSGNQTIIIEVVNPLNTLCTATTTVDLVVNSKPEFTVESPRIICSSDPNFSITLDVNLNQSGSAYNYEWTRTSLDNSVTNQFIANTESITVSQTGNYTVTLTAINGTNCSRSRTILVNASSSATLTEEDVIINDLSSNNSVSINTDNLGNGNYEYALQAEGSSSIDFQEAPVFNNVRPGIYTLIVNELICGTTTLEIAVVGQVPFFTPNADGFNDFWQLKGVSATIQPNTNILIFDRYGKLIKQLSPQSNGWDGTYNGTKMPTGDYWFKAQLEDGRELSGHFTLKR